MTPRNATRNVPRSATRTRLAATLLPAAALALALSAAASARAAPDPVVQQILADISASRIEARIRKLVSFETRHTESETASETRGIGAARRWIERELQACAQASGGRLQVSTQSWEEPPGRRVSKPTMLVNVMATLPGRSAASAGRMLVVSGHYDSRNTDVMDAQGAAPGANDDASGTAVVMELACAMARHDFDATLVFMAVPGEEQGLLGATHYAREARRKGLDIEAMITNDIVGSSRGDAGQHDPRRLRLFADGLDPLMRLLTAAPGAKADPAEQKADEAMRARLQAAVLAGGAQDLPTHQLGRHIKAAAEANMPGFTVQLIQRRDRYLRGGDHLPFLERGYAAVRISEPFENFDHQHQNLRTQNGKVYGDLPEFVDFAYVADVARANAAGLALLAQAPAAPREARIDATQLTNDTTLQWAASSDPAVKGYRIVWRDSDSATWQQQRDVGLVTRVTLPVSKDNVVFGVQALSAGGHASLASFPLPLNR